MTTYYVHKGVGNDTNTGLNWAAALASLNKAKSKLSPGDTVYVRAGATPYYEQLVININNTRWLADAGNQPVIDGKYHDGLSDLNISDKPDSMFVVRRGSANDPASLTGIPANDCTLDGFKICNVAGRALTVSGSRNVVRNCVMDFCHTTVCLVNSDGPRQDCVDNLIEDCEISRGSMGVYAQRDINAWGRPYDIICAAKNSERTTFRRLKVHHSFAEGIVIGKNTVDCVVEFCESYNNMHMCFYVNNCLRPTVRFCKGWSTGHPEMLRKGQHASEPFVIAEETRGAGAVTPAGQKIYGNIFVGGRWTGDIARMGTGSDSQLVDAYIGFNTFVGLPGVTQAVLNGGTVTKHSGSVFENNIIIAPAGATELFNNPTKTMTGVLGRGNVFYKIGGSAGALPGWVNGPGTIVADPKLVNATATIVDNGGALDGGQETGTNTFNVNNYKLTGASPAINNAVVSYPFNGHPGVETARTRDYFGAARNVPDCGAHEYGGTLTNSVVAGFSRSPSATTVLAGTTVNFTNSSFTTGTATITGQTWTVKKAGVTVASGATLNYQYTFATTGSYTVELAVTASGGLSDNEIVAYTVTASGGGVVVTAAFSAAPSQTTIPQGYTIAFTDQTTVQNGTQAGRTWEVLAMPAATVVATATTSLFFYQFNTAGSFRVRLTATATTGESDQETLDYTVTAVTTPTVVADFTASDADLIVTEGAAITFTNTSSVANTTISGYLWTVTALAGGGVTSYTTTNVTHTFGQAGLYSVRLLANTAAGVSDEKEVTVTVLASETAGMVFMAVPVQVVAATSTGIQTITAAALGTIVPKGARVRLIGATTADTAATGALWSEGATDGAAQWAQVRFSAHGAAAGTSWRRYARDVLAMSLDSAGAVTGEASFVRFVAGGMEINVTDAFPAGYLMEVIFYAGDACRFWAGTVTVGGLDTPVSVPVGFQPDAVFAAATWATAEDVGQTRAELSLGWAVGAGQQGCFRNEDRHAEDPSYLRTRYSPDYVATTSQGDGASVGGLAYVEAGGFDASGFTLTARSKSINLPVSLFAFSTGGQAAVQLVQGALSTSSPSVHGLAFEAQTVMALTATTRSGGLVGGDEAVGVGSASHSMHGPYSGSASIASANGAATTATRSLVASGWRVVNHDGALLWNGTTAVDADSLDITWSAAPAYAYKVILLAIEKAPVIVGSTLPVADFTQEVDYGDGRNDRVAVWFDGTLSNGRGYAITSYLWDFGDGETSTEASPFHVYTFPDAYTVSLTVTTSQGSDTRTKEALVTYESVPAAEYLVGLSWPATSGGPTENTVDEETGDHAHAMRFPWAHFEALDDLGVAAFLAMAADPVYALVAWDDAGNRWLIKKPDGTHRAVATTAV